MTALTAQQLATIKDAAQPWTGAKSRACEAPVALDDLSGSARRAETVFGWARTTVILGLQELWSGLTCVDNPGARGHRKTEEKLPQWAEDMPSLAAPERQGDPTFPSPFLYPRMTAKAMRQALIDQKGWTDDQWPCEHTIGTRLNRLGYRMRRVHKAQPVKRGRATEAIFGNVHQEHHASDDERIPDGFLVIPRPHCTWARLPAAGKRVAARPPKPGIMTCGPRKSGFPLVCWRCAAVCCPSFVAPRGKRVPCSWMASHRGGT